MKKNIVSFILLVFICSCHENIDGYKVAIESVKDSPIHYDKQVYEKLKIYKNYASRKNKNILLYALFLKSVDFENKFSFIFHCSWINETLKADAIKIIRPTDKDIILKFKKKVILHYRKALEDSILIRTSLYHCSNTKLPKDFPKGTQLVLLAKGQEISNRLNIEIITTKKFKIKYLEKNEKNGI
jgi:hypothetical protein